MSDGLSEKVYFKPGDVVKVRQELDYSPKMIVKNVDKAVTRVDNRGVLFGIRCFWFTSSFEYQEKIFNTKDLQKLSKDND